MGGVFFEYMPGSGFQMGLLAYPDVILSYNTRR